MKVGRGVWGREKKDVSSGPERRKKRRGRDDSILVSGIQHARLQRGIPGIEPGTSRTLSENHAARPNPQAMLGSHKVWYCLPRHTVMMLRGLIIRGSDQGASACEEKVVQSARRMHVLLEP